MPGLYWSYHYIGSTRSRSDSHYRARATYNRRSSRSIKLLLLSKIYIIRKGSKIVTESAHFPATRSRRLRTTTNLRLMIQDTTLSAKDFIHPLFVRPGHNIQQP